MRGLALITACFAAPALADPIPLPSGQSAELIDVIQQPQPHGEETWLILRLLSHDLAADPDAALSDLDWLCDSIGLRAHDRLGGDFPTLVVALMDRPVPWGETDPDAVQFVSSYRVEDGACAADLF